jgi:hypothetical protein
MRRLFSFLIVAAVFSIPARAQSVAFKVQSFSFEDSADNAEAAVLVEGFKEALVLRGHTISDKPQWTIFVAAVPGVDSETVLFAVTAVAALPERIVEFGGENEIFYVGLDGPRPEGGAFVRQMLSEDFLRGVGSVQDQFVRSARRGDLAPVIEKILDAFEERHFQKAPEGP